jgi:hypothetical protein
MGLVWAKTREDGRVRVKPTTMISDKRNLIFILSFLGLEKTKSGNQSGPHDKGKV